MLTSRRYNAGVKLQDAAVATGNGTVITLLANDDGAMEYLTLQTVGITTATITWEATIDGTNWVAVAATNLSTAAAATTATADGLHRVLVRGLYKFRARISAWTDGTITITAVATG